MQTTPFPIKTEVCIQMADVIVEGPNGSEGTVEVAVQGTDPLFGKTVELFSAPLGHIRIQN